MTIPPSLRNPWVGRESLLEELKTRLEAPGVVTLHGPPGVGKTRTALEYCRRQARDAEAFRFVDLSGCCCSLEILDRLDAAVRVPATKVEAEERLPRIARTIKRRAYEVIVLDNADQTVSCNELFFDLADLLPDCRILVTSRDLLGNPRERLFPIPSMSTVDAIALFHARALQWGASPDLASESTLEALVDRLEGLPLAIELAAYRRGVLSTADILRRIDSRFELLRRDTRPADLSLSLGAAIDESVSRLPEDLADALAACTVFAGGFSLPAVEAVLPMSDSSPLDRVQQLRSRSLLNAQHMVGGCRFVMLDSIREYVIDKGDPTIFAAARRRHAAHFAQAARTWSARVDSPSILPALAWFERERLNLARALRALEESAPDQAAAMALAMEEFVRVRGSGEEREALLEVAARCATDNHDYLRTRALLKRGFYRAVTGNREGATSDLDAATALQDESEPMDLCELRLSIFENLRPCTLTEIDNVIARCDRKSISYAHALSRRGSHRTYVHGVDGSEDIEEAVRVAEGQQAVASTALLNLTLAHCQARHGAIDAAESHFRHVHQTLTELDNHRLLAFTLRPLGLIEGLRASYQPAFRALEDALEVAKDTNDRLGELCARMNLGMVAWASGDLERATQELTRVHTAIGSARRPRLLLPALAALAAVHAINGDFEDADALRKSIEAEVRPLPNALLEKRFVARLRIVHACGRARRDRDATALAHLAQSDPLPPDASLILRVAERGVQEEIRSAMMQAAAWGGLRTEIPGLVVGDEERWARLPDGTVVDLGARANARRLLRVLVAQRLERPGVGMTAETLFAAVWSDERADRRSRGNRVRVTIADLRKRGLRELILRGEDGYRLREDVTVQHHARQRG